MNKSELRRVIEDVLLDTALDADDAYEAADSIIEICDERGVFEEVEEDDFTLGD